jgi:hypothetical protein
MYVNIFTYVSICILNMYIYRKIYLCIQICIDTEKYSGDIIENSVSYNSTGWVVGYDEVVDVWTSGLFIGYLYEYLLLSIYTYNNIIYTHIVYKYISLRSVITILLYIHISHLYKTYI